MATSTKQRVGIWIIAGALLVGTLGSFAVLILSPKNQAADDARLQTLQADYAKLQKDYETKVTAQTKELSDKYYGQFSGYQERVTPFDSAAVTELKKEDIVIGEGEEITETSTFSAYYIGWLPNGTVFDSSIKDGALVAPLEVTPGGVIEGWTKGAVGMKTGGVRELTIPASMAYGEKGSGDSIPANTPLKFVLMIIPTPEKITPAEFPQELLNYYTRGSF